MSERRTNTIPLHSGTRSKGVLPLDMTDEADDEMERTKHIHSPKVVHWERRLFFTQERIHSCHREAGPARPVLVSAAAASRECMRQDAQHL